MSEYGERPPGEHSGVEEQPHVVVRDRRRIDPRTGAARPPVTGTPVTGGPGRHAASEDPQDTAPAESEEDTQQDLRAQLDERTADLQRLTAEYANYRKRVDRDREITAATAKAALASQLLGVLDDVDRAAAHGDLTGAFKTVADKLANTLKQAGLAPFGHEGEPFDPAVHEAVQHDTSPNVDGPTVTAVLRRGYRFADRVVRAALVAVTDQETTTETTTRPVGEPSGEGEADLTEQG